MTLKPVLCTLRRFSIAPLFFTIIAFGAQDQNDYALANVVKSAVQPVMEKHDIPGLAVGVIWQGRKEFHCLGVASRETGQKVTTDTLFEIGSVSKVFTATLGAQAVTSEALTLEGETSRYIPALRGSAFDRIDLLHLATYTAGGLPLQFPDEVKSEEDMFAWYKSWQPAHPAGAYRQYSNPSIGLFGYAVAEAVGIPFDDLMEKNLFPSLGMRNTFINVPPERWARYAVGYSKDDKPVRVSPGLMDSQAYGVKTTVVDLARFVSMSINRGEAPEELQSALGTTQTGYYTVGLMSQGLGWEMYPYPTSLETLLAGNSRGMIFEANGATKLDPYPDRAEEMLFNKTGSTNGFGAYVVFVPSEALGVVILANRNYPIPERIRMAHQILTHAANATSRSEPSEQPE